MSGARRLSFVVALVATLACAPGSREPPTGYVGSWSRGTDRVRSTVRIERAPDGGYRFKLAVRSDDDGREVRCDDEGRCEERSYGRKVAEYHFDTRVDPESGHLIVDYVVRGVGPGAGEDRASDELVVEDGGRLLRALTVERNGQAIPEGHRPMQVFERVSR